MPTVLCDSLTNQHLDGPSTYLSETLKRFSQESHIAVELIIAPVGRKESSKYQWRVTLPNGTQMKLKKALLSSVDSGQ